VGTSGWRRRGGGGSLCAAVLAVTAGLGCTPASRPPNVLLISIDTLRADHTSVYGYARDTTPRLRSLADEGVRVETAYSPTASTGPSHATLFTGHHPISHGVVKNGLVLPDALPTLAERFAEHGYQTAGVASSFVLDPRFGFGRGFAYYDADFQDASITEMDWEGHHVAHFDRRASEATDTALAWLTRERDPGRPFLLFVHYFDPHSPYAPPGAHGLRFAEPGTRSGSREHRMQLYDAEVAYTDEEIGRLLDGLTEAGLAEDTLVVVSADHGEGLGDHGVLLHAICLYEEAVRVPLVLRWPGELPAGRTLEVPVGEVDLAPTLLELAGIPAESGAFQGVSLADALRGSPSGPIDRPVFLLRRHYKNARADGVRVRGVQHAVVHDGWKLILDEGLGTAELYDLERDPEEKHNRYEDEPVRAEVLQAEIEAWRARYGRAHPAPAVDETDQRALEALGYTE
jgi:arylsulfatase A-like enzyme